jgi:hypothetical protein
VADEKYFYHSYVLLLYALKCPVLRGIPAICYFVILGGHRANQGKI